MFHIYLEIGFFFAQVLCACCLTTKKKLAGSLPACKESYFTFEKTALPRT